MIEISLCMIVRNEAETLARCLDSVKSAVDEVIIVDTGSDDETKQIALGYTDKVYDLKWTDDFSAARNYAFSKADCDYIMWLDADDILTPENLKKLKLLKKNIDKTLDAVYMRYAVSFDENGKPDFVYYRERLFKRASNPVWVEPIHEVVEVEGKTGYSDVTVYHKKIKDNPPGRNLKIFEKYLSDGKQLSPRLNFYYARELMYNGRTDDAVNAFESFLNDGRGWLENSITACLDLADCYEKTGRREDAFRTVFRSFRYALPRAEALCRLGAMFFAENRLMEAHYWYALALDTPKPENCLGFIKEDCYGYVPALELCVISYRLGNIKEAIEYNETAGKIKPESSAYLYNKAFFEKNCKI